MKFDIENTFDKPIQLDGTSKITIEFEVGDIFIDINNKVKCIKNILKNKIAFTDESNNVSFETIPFNKEFFIQYRYAGTIQDNDIPIFEDALSLCSK